MMKRTDDMATWNEAVLDTPLTVPRGLSEEEAGRTPGCHVKSLELEERPSGFWPKYHGIIVVFADPDQIPAIQEGGIVVVRSIGSPVSLPGTVWSGTISEFYKMWKCD